MTPAGEISLVVPTAPGMQELGRRLAGLLRRGDLVLLSGDLGAGKTTLTAGIGAALGVRGAVTSPTFVLARVHPSTTGGPDLVHVDAYRLSALPELDDLDLDASLDDSVTVVEWATGKAENLAESRLEVDIRRRTGLPADAGAAQDDDDERRTVSVRALGTRWAAVDLGALADRA